MADDKPSPKWKRGLRIAFRVYTGLCTLLVTAYIIFGLWRSPTTAEVHQTWVKARYDDYLAKEHPKRGDYFCNLATMLGQYAEDIPVPATDLLRYLGKPDLIQGTTKTGVLLYFFTPSYTTNKYEVLAFLKEGRVVAHGGVAVSDGTTYNHSVFQPFPGDSAPNQQRAANGSQPIRSETNSTSWAAGSRR